MLTIVGEGGRKADLPRALVTALTAEITIYMREKPDDFFDHTDLLDFPGYRARYKLNDLRTELGTRKDLLKELFLRGKVAYLFERYREEKELTSMFLVAQFYDPASTLPRGSIPVDIAQAKRWYEEALQKGQTQAKAALDALKEHASAGLQGLLA
jgi:Uncharacterized protein conserved in bacteria, putative virulence factor